MGREYVKYVEVMNAFAATPQDGILDEFDTVSAFASSGIGTVAITRSTTDVFSGLAAMNVAITATASHSPSFRRTLPFPQQRYVTIEFAIGTRAGNVSNRQVTFDTSYAAAAKNGRLRFAIQNWDNDVMTIQVYNSVTAVYDNVAVNLPLPFEGKTFFIVRMMFDTFNRRWVSLEIAGARFDLSAYGLETITPVSNPDAANAMFFLVTAQALTIGNTVNMVMDRFKVMGTTYPQ